MKKVLLHIALVLAVMYGIISAVIILGQESYREVYIREPSENGLILPMPDIVGILLLMVLAAVFWVLLKNAGDYEESGREMAATILFSLVIIFGPAAGRAITAVQNIWYGRQGGASMLAEYSMLKNALQTADPFIKASMVLMLIYAAISIGEKTSIGEKASIRKRFS